MEIHIHNKCANVKLKRVECGREDCKPRHSFGPAIRQYSLVHYVERGKGVFKINEKTYTVGAGQIFYIPPRVITYYEADESDPWVYKWVGIEGRGVEACFANGGITSDNSVIYVNKSVSEIMDELIYSKEEGGSFEFTALVYRFLSAIGARPFGTVRQTTGESYVKKAIDYIHAYIHRRITVEEVSEYVNIDRSYLTSLFKKTVGICPQQYILQEKMRTACEYLQTTQYDISHISQSVGYDDLFVFSHAFKRIMGISPTEYRKSN